MAYANKLRESMAQQFLAALNEGQLPWKACWQQSRPENAVSGRPYRGINAAFLSYIAGEKGYTDHRWCTFRQIQEKGWQLQKGSKGCLVEYWAYYDKAQKKLLDWKMARLLLKDPDYARKNLVLRSRLYTVFNGSCIDGIPEATLDAGPNIGELRRHRDLLLRNMKLDYRETGEEAYYSPKIDRVTLPPENSFLDTYSYMGTFLHECAHAPGHPDRLDRNLLVMPTKESYAREELRAEVASAFTAQALGLQLTDAQLQQHMDLHKAYIQAWAQELKDAPDELFRAMKDAEQISDYLIEKGEFDRPLQALYAQPEFSLRQMQIIRQALAEGMEAEKVAVFAHPCFTPEQMTAICQGIRQNLSREQLICIADPELPAKEMEAQLRQLTVEHQIVFPPSWEPEM